MKHTNTRWRVDYPRIHDLQTSTWHWTRTSIFFLEHWKSRRILLVSSIRMMMHITMKRKLIRIFCGVSCGLSYRCGEGSLEDGVNCLSESSRGMAEKSWPPRPLPHQRLSTWLLPRSNATAPEIAKAVRIDSNGCSLSYQQNPTYLGHSMSPANEACLSHVTENHIAIVRELKHCKRSLSRLW